MVKYLLALYPLLFWSCLSEPDSQKKYLFLGHTYQWGVKDNNRIDYRLEKFDFAPFDQVWLGGDLCARTNESPATLAYLDSIFDLSSERTHWTWGNHDVQYGGSWEVITDVTQRKSYYSTDVNGICLVVLNTNEFHFPQYQPKPQECEVLDGQIQLLENIADTISEASHLVILHHLVLLSNERTGNQMKLNEIWNLYQPDLTVDCAGTTSFDERIYPLLERIQEKGIPVILVGGDLGQRSKAFEYQSEEGIWFLGSGINNSAVDHYIPDYVTNTNPDSILVFKHNLRTQKLEWTFSPLSDFVSQ
jgi:hypothetical protein